ncbi:MAG TPA: VanW family protein [Kofleriaceae bacterium]|nr:VanW family protein [Kofleriaceae bacterium]
MDREPEPLVLGDLSRLRLAARRAGVLLRRAARLAAWTANPADFPAPELGDPLAFPHLLYRRRWPIARASADARLEQGKRINLALAAPHVNGAVVAPDRPFSFWRAVPRPTPARGYRIGMELRGGCVVPTAGGGLCLLSNALFAAAAELGWRILERHGHTMTVIDRDLDLDATVLWPFVDLRFAPRSGRARLEVRAGDGLLEIAVHGDRPAAQRTEIHRLPGAEHAEAGGVVRVSAVRRVVRDAASGALVEDSLIALDRKRVVSASRAARSCLTCDRHDCRARPRGLRSPGTGA